MSGKRALIRGPAILTITSFVTRFMGFFYRIFLGHTFGEENVVHVHNDIISIITVLMNHILWYPFLIFLISYREFPVIFLPVKNHMLSNNQKTIPQTTKKGPPDLFVTCMATRNSGP